MGQRPYTLARRARQRLVYREMTGRVIIVIVIAASLRKVVEAETVVGCGHCGSRNHSCVLRCIGSLCESCSWSHCFEAGAAAVAAAARRVFWSLRIPFQRRARQLGDNGAKLRVATFFMIFSVSALENKHNGQHWNLHCQDRHP